MTAPRSSSPALLSDDAPRPDAPLRLITGTETDGHVASIAGNVVLSPAELEAFITGTSDVVLVLDAEGRCQRIVTARSSALICPPETLLGRHLTDVLSPDAASCALTVLGRALATGERQEFEHPLRIGDREVWFDATMTPTRDGTVLLIARDVTKRHLAEVALREREREVSGIFEGAFDGMLVTDASLRCLQVNGRLCELLKQDRATLLSLRYPDLVDPDDLRARPLRLTELYAAGRVVTERRLRRWDGAPLEAEVGTTMLEDGRILFVIRDITARKQAEATIRSLALTDELTGLYNRRGFLALAEREWDRAIRQQRGALLFTFDLDNLKPINDAHGHAVGDLALTTVANALRSTFRGSDVVGRLGGDEFAAFVVPGGSASSNEVDAAARLDETVQLIRTRLERHLASANQEAARQGQPVSVCLSTGVARLAPVYQDGAPSLAALLAEADASLYEEKRRRKRRQG